MTQPKYKVASAHGRFQPLHNEHLEYLLAAKRNCEFLWIGITMPDITPLHVNPLGRHRERPDTNPLTYFERSLIISEALSDSGVAPQTFNFVPFPIETPGSLKNYLPVDIPCLTTVCEEWNREKIALLKKLGYQVDVLFEREQKQIAGLDIRNRIVDMDSSWETMVPPATVRATVRLDLRTRLISLRTTTDVQ
jgi:nicotinamide mononucleotide adenylyltransferase